MADRRPRVLVDPETGSLLVVHRRTIGIGTVLFFLAVASFIAANSINERKWQEGLYSFGSLCCTLFMLVLIWRFCCCCCHPEPRTPGYVIVGNAQTQPGVAPNMTAAPQPAAYPVAPSVQPVLTNYPTPGFGTFAAPPFATGVATQPPYNPSLPPAAQIHVHPQQAPAGAQEASAPPCDAPPSYSEATGIPLKQ